MKVADVTRIPASSTSLRRAHAHRHVNALAVALLAALMPDLADAATVAGTYGTRDQVRQCAAEQDQLDARVRQRQAAHEAHVQALAKLEAESAEINRRQATVNQEDEAAVREFNGLVAAHNLSADKINDEAAESRAVADAYNADATAHNKRCAGLLIRPEDLAAVTRERSHGDAATTKKEPAGTASAVSR